VKGIQGMTWKDMGWHGMPCKFFARKGMQSEGKEMHDMEGEGNERK
jgi:hypothetical protein